MGVYNRELREQLDFSNMNELPESLRFRVNVQRRSRILEVAYDCRNKEIGLAVLDKLNKLLARSYGDRARFFVNEIEQQLQEKREEIAEFEVERIAVERQIKNLHDRIAELRSNLARIRKNRSAIIEEKGKILSGRGDEHGTVSTLPYVTAIEQNLALENDCAKEIHEYTTMLEKEKLELEKLNIKLKRSMKEISNAELKRKSMRNIQTLQPATVLEHPVKPRTKMHVISATVLGLFAMLCLAFLLEYRQGKKRRREA
jgi:uncharacterized protein involved in exopolysaccharide biosynthesis